MLRRPPRSTRTATLCPYATLSRSGVALRDRAAVDEAVGIEPIGNHVGCYRIAHTHLRRLFCAIPCPHQPTDVNDPQQKNEQQRQHKREYIGRAHVLTPVTNAHLVCRLLLEKKKQHTTYYTTK